MAFHEIHACRVCGSTDLRSVLNLGHHSLSGVFSRDADVKVTKGPLDLVRCSGGDESCGLVQLRHTYDPEEMYGAQYGYRSALNRSMVEHLEAKVRTLIARTCLVAGDTVLDIGSNDGTTLSFYPESARLIGIDPSIVKFGKYYKPHIKAVPEFFSADKFMSHSGGRCAKIVTSIAMFYDVERPLDFMHQVRSCLTEDGVWHFEQSYLPSMLAATAYDTVCHEHVEYYSMGVIVWMADRAGFSIVDVSLNDVNGGSFAVTAVKAIPGKTRHTPAVAALLDAERRAGLSGPDPYARFAEAVAEHRLELMVVLNGMRAHGKRVLGMGASTKGNVILQYCGIGTDQVECIADVNEDKFGCFTPGTRIPIVSEVEADARNPDVMLVLPWHFRKNIIARSSALIDRGVTLLFPLPKIQIYP